MLIPPSRCGETAGFRFRGAVWAALAALLLVVSPVLADRGEVRKAMDAMEKAVLAGDKEGYLANVWKEDACFLQEQKNWALDFDRHRTQEFSITVDDEQPSTFGDTEAHFTMAMSWSMGSDVPRGTDRHVSFPVVFYKKDGVWLFGGEDWHVLNAPGVGGSAGAIAKFLDGGDGPAANVVAVLPEVRAHVDEGFDNKITRVQEVKLYKSVRHLQESIYLSYTDGLGGWNEPGEAIKALESACRSKGVARTLLAHEYGHCATFEFGPAASKMPWWILEGVAELSAEEFSPGSMEQVARTVERWARRGELAPWDEMADFHKCPKKWMGHVYTQGHHMLGYVSDNWRRAGRNAWLRQMAQGKSLDEATQAALGISFDELSHRWRASLPDEEPQDQKGANVGGVPEKPSR